MGLESRSLLGEPAGDTRCLYPSGSTRVTSWGYLSWACHLSAVAVLSQKEKSLLVEKILRISENQPFHLLLPTEPHTRRGRQGCRCHELSWGTAELLCSAPRLSVKISAGVIPCKSQILTVVKVIIMISFPAPKISFAKAGGGKSN